MIHQINVLASFSIFIMFLGKFNVLSLLFIVTGKLFLNDSSSNLTLINLLFDCKFRWFTSTAMLHHDLFSLETKKFIHQKVLPLKDGAY